MFLWIFAHFNMEKEELFFTTLDNNKSRLPRAFLPFGRSLQLKFNSIVQSSAVVGHTQKLILENQLIFIKFQFSSLKLCQ